MPNQAGKRERSRLEWVLLTSVGVETAAQLFQVGVADWPVWGRIVHLGLGALAVFLILGLLESDPPEAFLILGLGGAAGLFKPAISSSAEWASFYAQWGRLGRVLIDIQLVTSPITAVSGCLLYLKAVDSARAGEESESDSEEER